MNADADSITIVRARSRRLAKLVQADGSINGYDSARTFDMIVQHVPNLCALAEALHGLLPRWNMAVVRGEVIDPATARGVRRLLHPDRATGEGPTLRAVPRRWLALDFEDIPRPPDVPATDLSSCARLALAALPPVFARATCVVQASGSHGFKPDIRLRLWFWCSRPMSDAELRRWLRDTPADPAVFGAAQLIYTARPVFAGGVLDPIADRLVWLPGEAMVAVPPPEAVMPIRRPLVPRGALRAAHPIRYARAALVTAAERIISAPKRHPAIIAECLGLARLVSAGIVAEPDLRAVVLRAAEVAGKDDRDEIERCIAWALVNSSGASTSGVSDA